MRNILNQEIIIHWWNMGKKTLDFKGTIEDCLKSKGVDWTDDDGLITFKFNLGVNQISLETYDPENTIFKVFAFIAVHLGDKAQIECLGRKQKFNWR